MTVRETCKRAKENSGRIANAAPAQRDEMLRVAAESLIKNQAAIIAENARDMEASTRPKQFLDRLRLDEKRIRGMADGLLALTRLPDPLGRKLGRYTHPNGLEIEKVSVPLGVVAIIYEARPNVTADCIGLCIKSGNAIVLRGSKDAIFSNTAIVGAIKDDLERAGFAAGFIQLVEDVGREGAEELMRCKEEVDVLIPRGSASLIRTCVEKSLIPVIETGTGNCHVYVERTADLDMAADIVVNAKVSRPSVCNACESLVVDREIVGAFLPLLARRLAPYHVELRGDLEVVAAEGSVRPATEEDYYTEYLDYILSVKTVSGREEAVDWINEHGTHHSESIVTQDAASADFFTGHVDSAAVYVNASTRFTDGFEFGLGAELGISTQKLHARGPMGLEELTSYKYVVRGTGQIRE